MVCQMGACDSNFRVAALDLPIVGPPCNPSDEIDKITGDAPARILTSIGYFAGPAACARMPDVGAGFRWCRWWFESGASSGLRNFGSCKPSNPVGCLFKDGLLQGKQAAENATRCTAS